MKAVLILATMLLTGCVVQQGPMTVNVLCNKTIVNRDGLHYTKAEVGHVHCDKEHPLTVSLKW